MTVIHLALKIYIFSLECTFPKSAFHSVFVYHCIQTCTLLFFLCIAHWCYSLIHHALDENVVLRVKKRALSCFIRISLACPINGLKGTFVLQLTLSSFPEGLVFLLKAFSCHSWFLQPPASELESGTSTSRVPYCSRPRETSRLPRQRTSTPSPKVLAVRLPSFGPLLPCSLLSSVFYHLIKCSSSLSWVMCLSEVNFTFWRKRKEKETSSLVQMKCVRLVFDGLGKNIV